MSDRATSLLRTVFRPVYSLLPRNAVQARDGVPASLHQSIPAINLQGVILEPRQHRSAAVAAEMYSGIYRFGNECVTGLPDTIFSADPPSSDWRSTLLRMEWLSSFRVSGKTLHGLFALRLISAWVTARPSYVRDEDRIAVLYSLAIDAPALASTQSPAAVAVAQAAILQAWHSVAQIKPKGPAQALSRCIAQLAAHLAVKPPDAQRAKLLDELAIFVAETLASDGSHVSGSIDDAIKLMADLDLLARGLTQGGEQFPRALAENRSRLLGYLSLLLRPDGCLAFHTPQKQNLPTGISTSESGFAEVAGHARLTGTECVVFVAAGEEKSSTPLLLDMQYHSQQLFWLEEHPLAHSWRRGAGQMICASGGSLLELNSSSRHAENRKVSVFLAASGHDIRLENSDGTAAYDLWFPETARLSTTHSGAGALITMGKLGNWQLLARNCIVTQNGAALRISAQSPTAPMNFAMKHVERDVRRKSTPKLAAGRLL